MKDGVVHVKKLCSTSAWLGNCWPCANEVFGIHGRLWEPLQNEVKHFLNRHNPAVRCYDP